jgi:hypothetical protein
MTPAGVRGYGAWAHGSPGAPFSGNAAPTTAMIAGKLPKGIKLSETKRIA